ncbi:NAD-dependent epimerase/dehydratase family protein [Isoptericola sp. 178]|uniref:NAD-dependent epimerase/dehydratase family protein n=1 Tax=Isoptericola sp. 178 TaxID=3064651 RepID=UPI00271257F7|nr:NAD-dependent epimerase/dehydratase family protein [Isoptericola sp. 178]MDO8144121.1 NAD-dependent epimerase/dehydratase family protein [Isoptericola sp. 178]
MRTALIGWSGFVGSNIAAARSFDALYNTSNIDEIRGQEFDLVVSAAARADSHRINADGARDRAEIDDYVDLLETVKIGRLVLASTVCIYPGGTTPDESTPLSEEGLTPYGANRLHMERRLSDAFDLLPVRLPQLYGRGIKKGIVYDLMNDYRVEFIRPEGLFQYYDLRRLWSDTQRALDAGIDSLNIATPAITSADIAQEVFGRDISGQEFDTPENPLSRMYTRDMRTEHASLYGGPDGYLMSRQESLDAVRSFVVEARAGNDA